MRRALAAVRAAFGVRVFDAATGALDRAALRAVVFADATRRRELEAILHPRVRAEWQAWLQSGLQIAPDAVLIVEIPLLYETGAAEFFDQVIVVGCSLATQMRRLTWAVGWRRKSRGRSSPASGNWPKKCAGATMSSGTTVPRSGSTPRRPSAPAFIEIFHEQ